MRIRLQFAVLFVAVFACSMHAAPAQAQRVFVSATGSDGNPCTFASPCRTFQHAHDIAPSNGEIDVLDPAGYGALTITKAISIQGHGFSGISSASGDAITINSGATDRINLRGLLIDGIGTGGVGIKFNSGAVLDIQDCLIRNFSTGGISSLPNSSVLLVSDTHVASVGGNTASGIGAAGSGAIDRVVLENNDTGLSLSGTSNFTISNSVIANNLIGVETSSFGASGTAMVWHSSITNNGVGLRANGNTATIRFTKSTITGNSTGLSITNSGTMVSFGDNALAGNTTDGAPTSTIVLK